MGILKIFRRQKMLNSPGYLSRFFCDQIQMKEPSWAIVLFWSFQTVVKSSKSFKLKSGHCFQSLKKKESPSIFCVSSLKWLGKHLLQVPFLWRNQPMELLHGKFTRHLFFFGVLEPWFSVVFPSKQSIFQPIIGVSRQVSTKNCPTRWVVCPAWKALSPKRRPIFFGRPWDA